MRIEKKEAEITEDQEKTAEELAAESAVIAEQEKERVHKIEQENAELRGKASAFESMAKGNQSQPQVAQDQWKSIALTDSNNLSDDEYFSKYKITKLQGAQAIHEYEIKNLSESQSRKFAKMEAENKLLTKYPDLYENSEAIQEAINDASPEVRADSERLAKVIERAYLATGKGQPKPKGEPLERKQITSGFERVVPRSAGTGREKQSDEIPPEYAPILKHFGVTSEKERQKLMSSDEVETHYGDGIVFRDSEKGFEKVA